MHDLEKRILSIISQPHLAKLATITEDGKPWVRYVFPVAQETMTIHFATFINSRKVCHIQKNAEVHLTCGVANPETDQHYLQIQGKAKLHKDQNIRHQFWNPTLENIFSGPDDPDYGVIEVIPYRIEYCSIGSYVPEIWTTE